MLAKLGSERVYVAMSGGVDSSTVAALLARRLGAARVRGVYMQNWTSTARCQERNWQAVREIGASLGIGVERVDLEREYWHNVFEPMLHAYQRGLTPNPDVSCNHYIKFGRLVEHLKARDPEFSWIASGHYAGVDHDRCLVRRARYLPKDQSYYLATVPPATLKHVLLPLARKTKPEVRRLAARLGLGDVAQKPDSQGLCFVEQQQSFGQRGFAKFLGEYLVEKKGPFVLASDRSHVVGEHSGLWTHTIGQRASVSLPQHIPEFRGQWFVVDKDVDSNALVLDRGRDSPLLMRSRVRASQFQWHAEVPLNTTLYAQYRSLQDPWKIAGWHQTGDSVEFTFAEPRRAVAPGQYLVVYQDDAVVGAGIIEDAL